MSSRSEGVPRVIMEAFARARPVVAPAVGGIGDIVTPGETGLLVAPGDPGALADALVRVLTDRDLATRMGEAGHRQVEGEGWSAEGFARSVRGVVDSVLAEAG
jgi:glycosyltransferase involved in cell wall biosynthesis